MSNTTTTEATTDETSTTSVPQSETDVTATQDSQVTSDETSETTTTDQQPSIEALQAQIRRLEAAQKKANTEAKNYRLEAAELKKFKEQTEAEKLSEADKQELARKNLEQQLADIKRQYDDAVIEKQEIKVRHAIQLQATRLGVEPDVAERLLDRAAVEYDDDGTPNNVTALLNDLVKSKPYLVKSNGRQAPTSGGATNPPRSTTNGPSTASEYIVRMSQGKLSDSEYNSLSASMKAEIQAELIKSRRRR